MTKHTAPSDTISDRIKLPLSFDVEKMKTEVEVLLSNSFTYYEVIPLRSPAHLVDTSLPFPPPADDYADGSWADWLDTPVLEKCPYLASVIDVFRQHTTVNLVRLLRLAPEAEVREHTDPTLGLQIERSVVRLTIPIITSKHVEFFLNGTQVPMKPGECWYLRLTDPHKIIHSGEKERVNMTIDMIPNEWVRSMIMNAEE